MFQFGGHHESVNDDIAIPPALNLQIAAQDLAQQIADLERDMERGAPAQYRAYQGIVTDAYNTLHRLSDAMHDFILAVEMAAEE